MAWNIADKYIVLVALRIWADFNLDRQRMIVTRHREVEGSRFRALNPKKLPTCWASCYRPHHRPVI